VSKKSSMVVLEDEHPSVDKNFASDELTQIRYNRIQMLLQEAEELQVSECQSLKDDFDTKVNAAFDNIGT
jgi:hypothetical protein